MTSTLGDSLNNKSKDNLIGAAITPGSVFLNNFEDIDHPKFFVIAGICPTHIFVCSVFINSNIHPSIMHKQSLLNLQVPIKKANNSFLDHDSFVCCSSPIPMSTEKISNWVSAKTCKIIGNIFPNDLKNIVDSLKNSGLLSDTEINLYFSN